MRDRFRHLETKSSRPAPQRERIAKVMARAGLCSRREAEAWIAEGRVAVNGEILTSPAVDVGPEDQVSIGGKPLSRRQRTRLFLFHKPRGLVTTNKEPRGRPTVFDYLVEHYPQAPRLVSVGRLDINTQGLLLLTNDGGLARVLELPATGWLRRYRVRAHGKIDQASLDRLAGGLTLDENHYAGIEAKLDRVQGANCWLTVGLREGKNREVKRVFEHLGLAVNRLIRLSFGPFQLGDLAEGGLEEVRTRVLRDQLGPNLLRQSGADLNAPIDPPQEMERTSHSADLRRQKPGDQARFEPPEPKRKPWPGPRKHVFTLRAESEMDKNKSGSTRMERSVMADRRGRLVAIERLVAAAPAKSAGKRKRSDARAKATRCGRARRKTR